MPCGTHRLYRRSILGAPQVFMTPFRVLAVGVYYNVRICRNCFTCVASRVSKDHGVLRVVTAYCYKRLRGTYLYHNTHKLSPKSLNTALALSPKPQTLSPRDVRGILRLGKCLGRRDRGCGAFWPPPAADSPSGEGVGGGPFCRLTFSRLPKGSM